MSPPLNRRSALSRADLIAALVEADGETPDATTLCLAEALCLEWVPPQAKPRKRRPPKQPKLAPPPVSSEPKILAVPLKETLFWQVQSVEFFTESVTQPSPPVIPPYRGWRWKPQNPAKFQPLASWPELAPRLRKALCDYREGRAVDLTLTVRLISQGRLLERFPRERRHRWGSGLMLIEDDSNRLIPYCADKRLVREAIQRLLPAHSLCLALMDEYHEKPEPLDGSDWPPLPGSLVLALGDLGCLAKQGERQQQYWLDIGLELRKCGCHAIALFPAPLSRCTSELAAVWQLVPWERPRPVTDSCSLEQRAERLLRLVAPAARIEPGLLRSVRLLLPENQADAGTESDVWQHSALSCNSAVAASLIPEQARTLRLALASEMKAGELGRLASLIKAWHGHLPEEIWFDELLNLDPDAFDTQELRDDQEDAQSYFAAFCDENPISADLSMPACDRAWLSRLKARSTEYLWQDRKIGQRLAELALAVDPQASYLPGIGACDIPHSDKPERTVRVSQIGDELAFDQDKSSVGSFLVDLSTRNNLIEIAPWFEGDDYAAFWETGEPPSWASDWGRDEYGAWAEFSVKGKNGQPVIQKMRWIEPGSFLMGSPETEAERFGHEGPQHEVNLQQGYWLFDTACTQALWQAVMDDNPSNFKGTDRPVEQVSWDDAQKFIKALNQKLPGLDLSLPSEAQWEYACRAGTATPFSFGDNITPEQVNYDGNYPYAGDKKGKYREETVPVKSLPANPWGLYEMHGNVDEWVQDAWHGNYKGAPTDGSVWESTEAGVAHVLRGGSWSNDARGCRSADRNDYQPDDQDNNLGFRCGRVQGRETGWQEGINGNAVELEPEFKIMRDVTVFISYSHDSQAHLERVLGLSERLRMDGIPIILDRYVEKGSPPEGWPRWMLNGLDNATQVLCVCTETYYRRFRGLEVPEKGKGVALEGALLTQYLYDNRSRTNKFVPVLFEKADEPHIPELLRLKTHYLLDSEDGYQALYDALLDQSGVQPGVVGELKRKSRQNGLALNFPSKQNIPPSTTSCTPDTDRILRYAPEKLIGREAELNLLNDAWTQVQANANPRPHVMTFVALGGEGKTSLVAHWTAGLANQGWPGCEAAFAWSFYSQGTREQAVASSDLFLREALIYFGDTEMANSPQTAYDKAKRLARLVGEQRALLILDGLEPLQYAPTSPQPGQLKDQAIAALLKGLAASSLGLCLVTTRYSVTDLKAYSQTTAPETTLLRLSKAAGVALLRGLGVHGRQDEFEKLVEDVRGHALTLNLLGSYLRDAHGGDIRQRDRVKLEDTEELAGHDFLVMGTEMSWLKNSPSIRNTIELTSSPHWRKSAVKGVPGCGRQKNGESSDLTLSHTNLIRLYTNISGMVAILSARQFQIITDCERLLVRQTQKPEWASAMGRDRYGLWADIAVESKQGESVIQRLRWIPPGRFMMGSLEGEPGRFDDEGPQHLVTISQGYWLFDTPCTQALWEAVMNDNPSEFKSPRRPVEKVSWNDAKTFLQRINEKCPGLDLALPNEAQWEYACRAGTNTALFTGEIEIHGERNAPALDDIAWYGGNSGVGYELEKGSDSSEWKEMQHPNPKSGTREVGQKQPNPWGLYDMLGNVWEWVEDPWHPNYEGAPIDGSLWQSADAGAARVLRGGSWYDLAGFCRSASRNLYQPDDQFSNIGFRCARVQS